MRLLKSTVGALIAALLSGCVGLPEGLSAVKNFEAERYLGQWYEIARLDHRFERGLSRVTAEYSRRDDGGIAVRNRGYDRAAGEWKEAQGRAYFLDGADVGRLKVSFFGPFYASYNIIALDADYRHALVTGPDRDYLWILAREPVLPAETLRQLVAEAESMGFATDELIYVEQDGATR